MIELQTSGVTAPYRDLVSSLEKNAKAVRDIVEDNPAVQKMDHIQELMEMTTYVYINTNSNIQHGLKALK